MEKINLTCTSSGVRIDKFICENLDDLTRSSVQKIIENGNVLVNGKSVNKNYKCKINDEIEVTIPDAVPLDVKAENIPLNIVYEDADLLVVNKPK